MYTFPEQSRIGTRVLYMLNESDCRVIQQERQAAGRATAHGNDPRDGQVLPGIIVAEFGPSTANLQVFLDGTDSYWPTSRGEFNPKANGRTLYELDGEPITFEQYGQLAGPNDVGAGESAATRVVKTFEPDARGLWIAA